jgi:OOP family OmpA-OmpF porin
MNMNKTSIMLAVAALGVFAAPGAIAQDKTGWYAGGSIGRTGASIDDNRIRGGLAAQGLATTSIDERDEDRGYKVFGGYQFNRNLAVEAGFFDLGSFGYTATTTPIGSLGGDIRIKGINLDLVGMFPITDKLSVLGRVGVTSARTRGSFGATGAASLPYASANPSERATNVKFGAGLNYDFTESLAMRLEAERYRVNDAVGNKGHVDMVSVGLVYRFGGVTPAPRAVVAPAPVYVAPAPAPAPAPVVVQSPPPPPPMVIAPAPAPAPYVAPVREPKPARN